jgi:hypothetical protein
MSRALVALTVFLDAERALARNHNVFALAIPARLGDLDLFAFPAANLAQAGLATAVGTAPMMAGEAGAAAGKHHAKYE